MFGTPAESVAEESIKTTCSSFDLVLTEYAVDHGQHVGTGAQQLAGVFGGNTADGDDRQVDLAAGGLK